MICFYLDTFNLTTNTYNNNNLTYLDPNIYMANKSDLRFQAFWNIWHANDLDLLNQTLGGGIEMGGHWRPSDCLSRHKVAVIIPYRDRLPHLMVLIRYLHFFLRRQMIEYQIFVVEPTTPLEFKFNKGRVMNSGSLLTGLMILRIL